MEKASKLKDISKQIILWNQHASGAYTASPLYIHYAYCWLRDGTFIAYAMDLCGEHRSAEAFYGWVDAVLSRKRDQVQALLSKKQANQWIDRNEFLNTRFHLDGRDDDSPWGHFQLDGYGAWLWGLAEHVKLTGRTDLLERYRGSIELTLTYISEFWPWPNFDCWEEFPDFVHPSTLACLYGGLRAFGELEKRDELLHTAAEIKRFLKEHCIYDGRFVKSVVHCDGNWQAALPGVDANLLWLSTPFQVFGANEGPMAATICHVKRDLMVEGGIHRYVDDTYYGGGAWLLLTAWYGLVLMDAGDREGAGRSLSWIEEHADPLGRMPEQVPAGIFNKTALQDWIARSGPPAVPLLWSHAMYLLLSVKLERA